MICHLSAVWSVASADGCSTVAAPALYGALYYYRLGEYKGIPEQPPPPPEPKFMPLHEIMGPWIQPSPYTPTPTPPVHATKFDAALAATLEAAKAAEGAKADVQQAVKKTTVDIQRPKEARLLATSELKKCLQANREVVGRCLACRTSEVYVDSLIVGLWKTIHT